MTRLIDDPLSCLQAMVVRQGNKIEVQERRIRNLERSNERMSKAIKKMKAAKAEEAR